MSASGADVFAVFKIVFFADRADAFTQDVFIFVVFDEMNLAFSSEFCFADFAKVFFNRNPVQLTTFTFFIFGHKSLGFAILHI